MSRILPFETVYNFRDFGDYPTRFGGRINKGQLFRSAHLNGMAGGDVTRFDALNISAIIDMRYAPERQKQPNILPNGHKSVTLAYEQGEGQKRLKVAPHEAFMEHDLQGPDDARNYMLGSYSRRPLDTGFQMLVRRSLKHMAMSGDNILVHCAAGKDRTGTLVAMIQHLLGVDKAAIFEDYMLTMTAIDMEPLLEMASKSISKRYKRLYNADMLRPLFGVSEDYLSESFNAMGDVQTYVQDIIGITSTELSALKTHYSSS